MPVDPVTISVIVPFHNEREHLARCVRALTSQTYPRAHYELLLVDNASTDGSADTIRDQPITLLHEPLRSSYAARNLGVRHASGHILAFTDGDCEADPRWLEHIARYFTNPEVALLIGERRHASDSWSSELIRLIESDNARRLTYGYTNNLAVRRTVFDRAGPFEPIARGADTNLFLRVKALYPHGVVFAPEVSIRHLELEHLAHHLHKQYLYGRSARAARAAAGRPDTDLDTSRLIRVAHDAAMRSLDAASRLRKDHALGAGDQLAMTLLAFARHAAFALGRLVGRLSHTRARGR